MLEGQFLKKLCYLFCQSLIDSLYYLKQNKRPGLKFFWKSGLVSKCAQERDVVQRINSILGSSGIKNHKIEIYNFLVADDIKKAETFSRFDYFVLIKEYHYLFDLFLFLVW